MKSFILVAVAVLISSCSYDWIPAYVEFEESIEHLTEKYGEPDLIIDTYFYDDGSVRNRMVYWDIESLNEIKRYDINGRPIYYRTANIEIWRQPDRDEYVKYSVHGWEIIRENMGTYSIPY